MKEYDEDFLEEITKRVDILKYAESQGYEFEKKGGKEYFTSCPLHTDVTPSLSITESDDSEYSNHQKWYCFSCRRGGTIINWLVQIEGLSFDDAVKKAAKLANMDDSKMFCSPVTKYFKAVKKANVESRKVIHNAVNESELSRFVSDNHLKVWEDEGISRNTLDTFGVAYDKRANRIIYPVRDINGKLINIKGRSLGDYKKRRIPKYMNYKEVVDLDYFQGLDITKPFVIQTGELIIFESIKSVMKVWDWGIKNACSCETHALTDGQVRLILSLGVPNVVLCFDKDVNFYKEKGLVEQLNKLKRFCNLYVVRDRKGLLGEKDSPADCGEEAFRILYGEKERW